MSRKGITISIISHKGGTGKTTSTVSVGAALAGMGYKVLVVDLDTQMNLTHWLMGDLDPESPNIKEVLIDKVPIVDIIRSTDTEGMYIAPAGVSLMDLEIVLNQRLERERRLQRALQGPKKDFDFILIDNPPHLGMVTVNSLVASDYFMVPCSAEYLSTYGLKQVLSTVGEVSAVHDIQNLGFLLTMVDRRISIGAEVESALRNEFGDQVLKTLIRVNAPFKGCPLTHQTIFDVARGVDKGAQDYLELTEELLDRLGIGAKKKMSDKAEV